MGKILFNIIFVISTNKVNMKATKISNIGPFTSQSHSPFHQILSEIQKTNCFEERLEIANDLYQLKQYKIMGLTPHKVS